MSGRGVGMDVVRANVEQIGGRVSLENRPGRGLTVVMEVPLTLSILSTIVVGAGGERFALPRQSVEEIVTVRGDAVRVDLLGDTPVVAVRGTRLPLVDLAALMDLRASSFFDLNAVVIVATRDGAFALAVDAVIDTEELVVKPAAPAIMTTGLYAGQTLPDSGLPMLLLDGAGIASAAGLRFGAVEGHEEEAEPARRGQPALLFVDLDGRRRAIALACVDRVETVPVDAVSYSAGRLRFSVEGRIVPLHAVAEPPAGRDLHVLRLTDGAAEVGYAIAEPIDIVELPLDLAPAHAPGHAGVAMIGDEQVEVIDPMALFMNEEGPRDAAPLCLLQPDAGGWMETFLKGTLEAAGYRCAIRLAPGEKAAVTLALDAEPQAAGAPGIRLSRDRAGTAATGAIHRYDRERLLAAVADHLAGRKSA